MLKILEMTWPEFLFSICLIVLGTAIYAFGMNCFILPNHFTTGGVAGLSVLLFYVFQIPVAVMNPILNGFLLILGWRFISKRTIILTIVSLGLISVFLDQLTPPLLSLIT